MALGAKLKEVCLEDEKEMHFLSHSLILISFDFLYHQKDILKFF